MSYKQLKWAVLFIPTIVIAIWEYIRHQFFLPYISMELGNWLAPIFVFAVSVTLLAKLFSIMENMQEALHRERESKAALMEREALARELHDGIAQSLFLMKVKLEQWNEEETQSSAGKERLQELNKTLKEIHEYVRISIAGLREPVLFTGLSWKQSLQELVQAHEKELGVPIEFSWELNDELFNSRDKLELYASIREALVNIYKHAEADRIQVSGDKLGSGWKVRVADNGKGMDKEPWRGENRFGLQIMKERAEKQGWIFELNRLHGQTVFEIRKETRND